MGQSGGGNSKGHRMSRPTEEQLKGILWTRYPQYFDIDTEAMRITIKDDAPPEVVESFNLFKEAHKEGASPRKGDVRDAGYQGGGNAGKVREMTKDHAVYEIASGSRRFTARLFDFSDESFDLTPEEKEIDEVVGEGFCDSRYAGRVGLTIDPFKAAEEILAERYGHARMTEANYKWKPNGIRY